MFSAPRNAWTTAGGRPCWPQREAWQGLGCKHCVVYRGQPASSVPTPRSPQPPPLSTSWAHRDAVFRRSRELEGSSQNRAGSGRVRAVLASWPERGQQARRSPCTRRLLGPTRAGAKHNRVTGEEEEKQDGAPKHRAERGAALLPRQPAPGLAQPFPWHLVLLSQQPQDGRALGSAAGWRREIGFSRGPSGQHVF